MGRGLESIATYFESSTRKEDRWLRLTAVAKIVWLTVNAPTNVSQWRNYTIAFLALAIIIKISETVRRYFANQQSVSDVNAVTRIHLTVYRSPANLFANRETARESIDFLGKPAVNSPCYQWQAVNRASRWMLTLRLIHPSPLHHDTSDKRDNSVPHYQIRIANEEANVFMRTRSV